MYTRGWNFIFKKSHVPHPGGSIQIWRRFFLNALECWLVAVGERAWSLRRLRTHVPAHTQIASPRNNIICLHGLPGVERGQVWLARSSAIVVSDAANWKAKKAPKTDDLIYAWSKKQTSKWRKSELWNRFRLLEKIVKFFVFPNNININKSYYGMWTR